MSSQQTLIGPEWAGPVAAVAVGTRVGGDCGAGSECMRIASARDALSAPGSGTASECQASLRQRASLSSSVASAHALSQ